VVNLEDEVKLIEGSVMSHTSSTAADIEHSNGANQDEMIDYLAFDSVVFTKELTVG
jgi:hypothetical protein